MRQIFSAYILVSLLRSRHNEIGMDGVRRDGKNSITRRIVQKFYNLLISHKCITNKSKQIINTGRTNSIPVLEEVNMACVTLVQHEFSVEFIRVNV